ncbi:DUF6350 family protein [Streptomyces sp. N2-109]|uniref:DUF6350 family protein n=1 Tax=Streptomyces gossypii TaxID=2883101 RepID=A0ABT2JWR8_9ACTN|nr:DUF6350 family protein [Streptomyces gossypii]MCT2592348.1 DUF6350 family protein [Streptomyces gossypii]
MSERTYTGPTTHPDGGTEPRPPVLSADPPRPRSLAGRLLLAGMLAAGLGLGTLAVVVLLLWIVSPYPGSGPGAALHIAADLWLLAHGAQLVRAETLNGGSAPVALTPLLLAALPAWLLFRVTRAALTARHQSPDGGTVRAAAWVSAGWVSAGYLLVSAAATAYASTGPLRVHVLSATLALPLFIAALTALAAATLGAPADGRQLPDALRAAGTGVGVLLGGGALLFLLTLARHTGDAWRTFGQLTGGLPDHLAVSLLLLALLPNAVVWGAAYGLGPGFALGTGSAVGPLGAGYPPELPRFPLLAALPQEGPGTPLTWATGVVPLAAGLAVGWHAARTAVPVPGQREDTRSVRGTTAVAALAACGCGVVMALLAGFSGGALGTGRLARLGPSWWLSGAAALGWTLLAGVPAALAVRGWRLRSALRVPALASGDAVEPTAHPRTRPVPADDWHSTAARRTRWAALKEAGGGLMPAFEPLSPREPEEPQEPVETGKTERP